MVSFQSWVLSDLYGIFFVVGFSYFSFYENILNRNYAVDAIRKLFDFEASL